MQKIKTVNKRQLFLTLCLVIGLISCSVNQRGLDKEAVDVEFDRTLNLLYETWPESQKLTNDASAILLIPRVTKASLGFGASYGTGKLKPKQGNNAYYNFIAGSWGLNAGFKQYSHILFFMTKESLEKFKDSNGYNLSAEFTYAVQRDAYTLGFDFKSITKPIIVVVFGQNGLMGGFNFEGMKYSKIKP